MSDLIDRDKLIDFIMESDPEWCIKPIRPIFDYIKEMPSAQPERKKGKWTEKQVIHADEAKEVVEEWQSCRCSICGHYNTQPYMYYFSEPNYCSFCGASMKEEATNAQLD